MNSNCKRPVTPGEIAKLVSMTEVSFSRFIKKRPGSNISDFNRIFKKKKTCTPKKFRENLNSGTRVFI
jgi:hypothetical protein